MRKKIFFIIIFWITLCISFANGLSVYGKDALRLHYSFEKEGTDDTGNGYDARLLGGASLVRYQEGKVLSLQQPTGYLDMGEKLGSLIASLKEEVTVSVLVYFDEDVNLRQPGGVIWTFSQSDIQRTRPAGLFSFSARTSKVSIETNKPSSNALGIKIEHAEKKSSVKSPLSTNVWHQIVYTQVGTTGTLYLDGLPIDTLRDAARLSEIGQTKFNWLGRSADSNDPLLQGALIDEFCIYNEALKPSEIKSKASKLLKRYNKKLTDMEVAQYCSDRLNLYPAPTEVHEGVKLPFRLEKDAFVQWSSSDPSTLSNRGKVAKRPAVGEPAKSVLLTATIFSGEVQLQKQFKVNVAAQEDFSNYLLVYFNDSTHSLFMALSDDGYVFTSLNDGKPVMAGDTISEQGGIRDPHIFRAPDGTFYLTLTDLHIFADKCGRTTEWQRDGKLYGWGNNRALVLLKSCDLIHWQRTIYRVDLAFPEKFGDIGCAWAPETTWDYKLNRLMIYFTMRHGNEANKVYYAYMNDEFTKMITEPKLLFEYPGQMTYIDSDIQYIGGKYHQFYVPHDGTPGIKQATSDEITQGYVYDPAWCDPESKAVEAPNVWRRINTDRWVLMYDIYGIQPNNFGFSESTDLINWSNLGRFNEGQMRATNFKSPKHGAVIYLKADEAEHLRAYWNNHKK
ncbi:MAG: immunoglobulin-like domain-containing protein [Bacteroidaceae bacterium]